MRRARRCAGFFVPEKRRNDAAQARPYMGKRAADPLPAFGAGSRDYDQTPKFPRPHAFIATHVTRVLHARYIRRLSARSTPLPADPYLYDTRRLPARFTPEKFLAKNPQKLSTVASLYLDHQRGPVQTYASLQ